VFNIESTTASDGEITVVFLGGLSALKDIGSVSFVFYIFPEFWFPILHKGNMAVLSITMPLAVAKLQNWALQTFVVCPLFYGIFHHMKKIPYSSQA